MYHIRFNTTSPPAAHQRTSPQPSGQRAYSLKQMAEEAHLPLPTPPLRQLRTRLAPNRRNLTKASTKRALEEMADAVAEEEWIDIADQVIQRIAQRQDTSGLLQQWNEDPSQQYLAVLRALHAAEERDEAPRLIEQLYDVAERMTALRGDAIFAGLNTVEQAKQFGTTRAATDLFRHTYRDAVLGELNFRDTLMLLLNRFGEDVERGVALLRKALAADLAAVRPSRDPERLNAILQDLYQLGVTAGLLPHCRTIAARVKHRYPHLQVDGLGLMKDVAQWTAEAWLMAYHVTHLMTKYRFKEEERQARRQAPPEQEEEEEKEEEDPNCDDKVAFLQGLLAILRALPPKTFLSDDHRLQAVAAVQQVLDSLLLEDAR